MPTQQRHGLLHRGQAGFREREQPWQLTGAREPVHHRREPAPDQGAECGRRRRTQGHQVHQAVAREAQHLGLTARVADEEGVPGRALVADDELSQDGGLLQPQVAEPLTPTLPTEAPKRRVIVARIDIPNNTVLTDTETYLEPSDIPEVDYNARPNQYFTSIGELQGKVTLQAITAAQPILKSDVIEGGLSLQIPPAAPNEPRPKAYPLQVNNLSGVADQIRPGGARVSHPLLPQEQDSQGWSRVRRRRPNSPDRSAATDSAPRRDGSRRWRANRREAGSRAPERP